MNGETESEAPEPNKDNMAPLTPEDAATLMATAMAGLRQQQHHNFAQLIAAAFTNAPSPQVQVQNVNGLDGHSAVRPVDVGYFYP